MPGGHLCLMRMSQQSLSSEDWGEGGPEEDLPPRQLLSKIRLNFCPPIRTKRLRRHRQLLVATGHTL